MTIDFLTAAQAVKMIGNIDNSQVGSGNGLNILASSVGGLIPTVTAAIIGSQGGQPDDHEPDQPTSNLILTLEQGSCFGFYA
jgi:hypothetical protein